MLMQLGQSGQLTGAIYGGWGEGKVFVPDSGGSSERSVAPSEAGGASLCINKLVSLLD